MGCEGGERGRLYTYRYTVTTRMTSTLRWAAMTAILMFQQEVMDKVTRQRLCNVVLLPNKRTTSEKSHKTILSRGNFPFNTS